MEIFYHGILYPCFYKKYLYSSRKIIVIYKSIINTVLISIAHEKWRLDYIPPIYCELYSLTSISKTKNKKRKGIKQALGQTDSFCRRAPC